MTDKTKIIQPYQEHIDMAKLANRKPLSLAKWKKLYRKNQKKEEKQVKIV